MYSSSLGMMHNAKVEGVGGGGGGNSSSLSPPPGSGYFYPRRVTYVLSALKILVGCGLVVLGALALYQKAAYARSVSGLWGGIIVVISGVLGIFSVRTGASRVYVLSFFAACTVALIADVLVVIYSATGLAQDSGFPGGFVRDDATGELIPVSQVNIPAREKAMLVNLLLVILGVLDILFNLPSFIICLREVCQCYSPSDQQLLILQQSENDRGRNDWLLSWLGHQQQQQQQIFFSSASGQHLPFKTAFTHPVYSRATPPFVLLPSSEHSHQQSKHTSPRESHRSRESKSPPLSRPRNVRHYAAPIEIYQPHQIYYPSYPSPGSNLSHPSMAQLVPIHAASPPHQWVYSSEYGHPRHSQQKQRSGRRPQQQQQRRTSYSFSGRKREGKSSHHAEGERHRRATRRKRSSAGPTDSDIDRTYTGLDRELAEEFIEQTMDPAIVLERTKASSAHLHRQGLHPKDQGGPLGGASNAPQAVTAAGAAAQSGTESEAW